MITTESRVRPTSYT